MYALLANAQIEREFKLDSRFHTGYTLAEFTIEAMGSNPGQLTLKNGSNKIKKGTDTFFWGTVFEMQVLYNEPLYDPKQNNYCVFQGTSNSTVFFGNDPVGYINHGKGNNLQLKRGTPVTTTTMDIAAHTELTLDFGPEARDHITATASIIMA